jgi:enoyl-CoA hydratase
VSDEVLVRRDGAVLVVEINRPERRNALDKAVADGVAAACDELDADDGLRAGVLTGSGGFFSSGMDLKAFLAGETPVVEGRGLCGITITPPRKPLVGAVEGGAFAGGLELLLACDLVVAAESARFAVPEVKRGLVAAGGAALLLPRRLSYAVAMEMLLTGEPITSATAHEAGLLSRVTPDGQALTAALELARAVAANGPLAVAATKQVVRSAPDWSWEESWARQREVFVPVLASQDAKEGAAAFAEKREPLWRGR